MFEFELYNVLHGCIFKRSFLERILWLIIINDARLAAVERLPLCPIFSRNIS